MPAKTKPAAPFPAGADPLAVAPAAIANAAAALIGFTPNTAPYNNNKAKKAAAALGDAMSPKGREEYDLLRRASSVFAVGRPNVGRKPSKKQKGAPASPAAGKKPSSP